MTSTLKDIFRCKTTGCRARLAQLCDRARLERLHSTVCHTVDQMRVLYLLEAVVMMDIYALGMEAVNGLQSGTRIATLRMSAVTPSILVTLDTLSAKYGGMLCLMKSKRI